MNVGGDEEERSGTTGTGAEENRPRSKGKFEKYRPIADVGCFLLLYILQYVLLRTYSTRRTDSSGSSLFRVVDHSTVKF